MANPSFMKNSADRWLATAGILAPPFYFALVTALGALEPEYSHLTKMMSVLGGVSGARGTIFNIGVMMTGSLVIAFALGLQLQLPPKVSSRVGVGLLTFGGVGLIGSGIFSCNEGCRNILTEPDLIGRLHMIASLFAGMGTALAPFFIWAAMRGEMKWKRFVWPTFMTAILANLPGITLWATIFTDTRLVSIEGLIQRLGLVFTLIWIFFVSARLLQLVPLRKN